MENYDNPLRRQVLSLPELLKQQYEDLEPKTRKVLTTPEIFSIQKIVLTGCGDSIAAAMATKTVFEKLTGLPIEVVQAIELSRMYPEKQLGFAPNNPLVIAISNSGGVARVGEAIMRANEHGAFTLGITGNSQSLLGKNAQRVLDLDIPSFESAPGTRSYMVSVLALTLLAIRIGEVRGAYTMDKAMSYRHDIIKQAELLKRMLPEMDKQVYEIAEKWQNMKAYDFVGCGRDYATAWFGQAKILEALGKFAMHINTEEWLHLNFFMRDADNIGTVLVVSKDSPAFSRAREVLECMHKLQRPTIVITDADKSDFGVEAEYIKIPASQYSINIPLTQFVPICLLVGYICEMIGEEYGRGCKDRWSFCEGGACTKNSEIIVL